MVRNIKFPLDIGEGLKVRTLEELQENFNLEKVLGYYMDGRLLTWLSDRYYEDEVSQIRNLDKNAADFKGKLCEILGVEIEFDEEIDLETMERRNARIAKLKQFTDDETILKNIDYVAFNQEEMADLLDENVSPIYLCGKKFTIPVSKENVTYIGVNSPIKPEVTLTVKKQIDFDKKNISFINVYLTSENEITLAAEKSRDFTLDSDKIKTYLTFESVVTTFITKSDNIREDHWFDERIYLYKNLLIRVHQNLFNIIDINTRETLVSYSDIKPDPVKGYKPQCIRAEIKYKNYLIIYWGENENSLLQLFNLDTLKSEKAVPLPDDSNYYVTHNVFMDVYDDVIGLYSGLGAGRTWSDDKVQCQYHHFPSLDLIETKQLNQKIDYYHIATRGTTYKGNAFRFFPSKMNIDSTQKQYSSKGILNQNQKASIGLFKIINDKIFATHCSENNSDRKHYDSIVDIGEIGVFNINGGEPLAVFSVFDSKITEIMHCKNMVIIWGENVPYIYFYDDNSLELVNKLPLDLTLGEWSQSDSWIVDVYIDEDTHRMAIAYNGIIAIYE